jgi:hypothetical protein
VERRVDDRIEPFVRTGISAHRAYPILVPRSSAGRSHRRGRTATVSSHLPERTGSHSNARGVPPLEPVMVGADPRGSACTATRGSATRRSPRWRTRSAPDDRRRSHDEAPAWRGRAARPSGALGAVRRAGTASDAQGSRTLGAPDRLCALLSARPKGAVPISGTARWGPCCPRRMLAG